MDFVLRRSGLNGELFTFAFTSLSPIGESNPITVTANHGCHLAFLKRFARNIMIWLFDHFLNVEENSVF
jgi:hypothetical protein